LTLPGDHRRVARLIADSESTDDFLERLERMWAGQDVSALARKADGFAYRKLAFRQEVKRIAGEVFKE